MSKPLYFSAKSIGESKRGGRKPQSLLVAASHNLRDHQAEQYCDTQIEIIDTYGNPCQNVQKQDDWRRLPEDVVVLKMILDKRGGDLKLELKFLLCHGQQGSKDQQDQTKWPLILPDKKKKKGKNDD